MKRLLTIVCLAALMSGIGGLSKVKLYAEENSVFVPFSLSYSSVYWWRGTELDGDGVGVFWPGIGIDAGDFSIGIAAGISEDWMTVESEDAEKLEKEKTELDYGISFSKEIGIVSLGAGAMFVHYPFFDETDETGEAVDPSFVEASFSVGLGAMFSPAVGFYYDYYIEVLKDEAGEELPVDEDYYVTFSLSQDIISTDDGFSFSLSGLMGYYNNAYCDLKGFSDAVITAGIAKNCNNPNNLSFSAGMNYGRTLGKDFRDANEGIKNHFWCDFGVSYSL